MFYSCSTWRAESEDRRYHATSARGVDGADGVQSHRSLERALTHYMAHYREERNHQGLQNRLLKRSDRPVHLGGRVERRERLGGVLNYYYREAA